MFHWILSTYNLHCIRPGPRVKTFSARISTPTLPIPPQRGQARNTQPRGGWRRARRKCRSDHAGSWPDSSNSFSAFARAYAADFGWHSSCPGPSCADFHARSTASRFCSVTSPFQTPPHVQYMAIFIGVSPWLRARISADTRRKARLLFCILHPLRICTGPRWLAAPPPVP